MSATLAVAPGKLYGMARRAPHIPTNTPQAFYHAMRTHRRRSEQADVDYLIDAAGGRDVVLGALASARERPDRRWAQTCLAQAKDVAATSERFDAWAALAATPLATLKATLGN